jgi:argininosuccinate lyase
VTAQGYSLKLTIPPADLPDFYASMSSMNKASLVMLHESGIVPDDLASRIAAATRTLVEREAQPGARRSHDYLDFERELLGIVGAEASWLHVGRSRQDMLSAGVSLWLSAAHLAVFEDLLTARQSLLDFAAPHTDTIIPIYTHGVQAQPTTLAHYLHAIAAGLERTSARVSESYARTNRNPLGAGAGTTSSLVIDRKRLAELLGFEGVTDNAFDANLVAPVDSALELAQILATAAIQIAQLTQDLLAQFYLVDPWFVLDTTSTLTGISSMMPQKRNPRVLEVLREHASIIVGDAGSMTLLAHNVTSGMTDVRETVTSIVPVARTHEMLFLVARTFEAARVYPQRSLAEVNRDYSAMTNLAEVLVQSAQVPFREAHEFASALTDLGRQRGLRPPEIAFADAAALYQEHLGTPLPLSQFEFAGALDPRQIIATRRGQGGPQPAEMQRMLSSSQAQLAADREWLAAKRTARQSAASELERTFHALVG